jgi:hypothetical protein
MGLLQDAYPDLKTPDRRALALLLEKKAKEATVDLKRRLRLNDSKVSLALDAWTCRSNNTAFQGISLSLSLSPVSGQSVQPLVCIARYMAFQCMAMD